MNSNGTFEVTGSSIPPPLTTDNIGGDVENFVSKIKTEVVSSTPSHLGPPPALPPYGMILNNAKLAPIVAPIGGPLKQGDDDKNLNALGSDDNSPTKSLHIAGLHRPITQQDLRDVFSKYGKIDLISVKRGYAFVNFENEEDAAFAKKDLHGQNVRGNRLTISFSKGQPGKILLARNLSEQITDSDLRHHFEKLGAHVDRVDRTEPTQALIYFAHKKEAMMALISSSKSIKGQNFALEYAQNPFSAEKSSSSSSDMFHEKDEGFPTRHLWLGNFPTTINEHQLRAMFGKYGTIDGIKIVREKKGIFAFVDYLSTNSAKQARQSLNGTKYHGRPIVIRFAKGPSRETQSRPSWVQDKQVHGSPSRHLWIGNVNPDISEKFLHNEFGRFGRIESVKVLHDSQCAFINFERVSDAEAAYDHLNGRIYFGSALKIDFQSKDEQDKRPQTPPRPRTPPRSHNRSPSPKRKKRSRSRSRSPEHRRERKEPKPDQSRDQRDRKASPPQPPKQIQSPPPPLVQALPAIIAQLQTMPAEVWTPPPAPMPPALPLTPPLPDSSVAPGSPVSPPASPQREKVFEGLLQKSSQNVCRVCGYQLGGESIKELLPGGFPPKINVTSRADLSTLKSYIPSTNTAVLRLIGATEADQRPLEEFKLYLKEKNRAGMHTGDNFVLYLIPNAESSRDKSLLAVLVMTQRKQNSSNSVENLLSQLLKNRY